MRFTNHSPRDFYYCRRFQDLQLYYSNVIFSPFQARYNCKLLRFIIFSSNIDFRLKLSDDRLSYCYDHIYTWLFRSRCTITLANVLISLQRDDTLFLREKFAQIWYRGTDPSPQLLAATMPSTVHYRLQANALSCIETPAIPLLTHRARNAQL